MVTLRRLFLLQFAYRSTSVPQNSQSSFRHFIPHFSFVLSLPFPFFDLMWVLKVETKAQETEHHQLHFDEPFAQRVGQIANFQRGHLRVENTFWGEMEKIREINDEK